jgi:subtilisin family serine protease
VYLYQNGGINRSIKDYILFMSFLILTIGIIYFFQIVFADHNDKLHPYKNLTDNIIPNEYVLVLTNKSLTNNFVPDSTTKSIIRSSNVISNPVNISNFVDHLQKYNINVNEYDPFKIISVKIPKTKQIVTPAGFINGTRVLTLGDIRNIFAPISSPAGLTDTLPASNPSDVCNIIQKSDTVGSCEPNRIAEPASISYQTMPTGISRIGLTENQSLNHKDFNNVSFAIGIVDTGVNIHPDLNIAKSVSFVGDKQSPDYLNDNYGHGTHVAGIIGAKDNNMGIIGVAPDIKLWSIKIFDRNSPGAKAQTNTFISALKYILDHRNELKVINISFQLYLGEHSNALENATKELVNSGVTIVGAAGNAVDDVDNWWPGNDPNVISVAAFSDSDGKCGKLGQILRIVTSQGPTPFNETDDSFASDYSNFGPDIDIAAPGSNINSTWNNGEYKIDSGTSMAAPYVSGAAGLYIANYSKSGIFPTPLQVKKALLESSIKENDTCNGGSHGYISNLPEAEHYPLLYAKTLYR